MHVRATTLLISCFTLLANSAEVSSLSCFNDVLLTQCNASCYCAVSASARQENITQSKDENVALAFGLVTAAGLSTTFGASLGNLVHISGLN